MQQIGSPEYAPGILERARHGAADPETLRTSAFVLPVCYEARLQKKVARAQGRAQQFQGEDYPMPHFCFCCPYGGQAVSVFAVQRVAFAVHRASDGFA